MLTKFRTEHELYRFARPADIADITTMLQDEDVGRWLWFVPATPTELARSLTPVVDAQWQSLADAAPPTKAIFVVEDADGGFLGEGGVMAIDGSAGGFEIGYQLRQECWGRGVGSRLAWFLAAWAVHVHGAYRIEAGLLEGNERSEAVARGLGLEREGRRPGYRLKGETRHAELLYGAEVSSLDANRLVEVARSAGLLDD